MRVNLKSLGCRLNEAELETWAQQFQAQGHRVVADSEPADLVVLNSCAVTQDAERKSRHTIRKIHRENPSAKLVVSGCYASLNPEEVQSVLGVDLVVSNADKSRLVEKVQETLALPTVPAFAAEPGEASLFALGRQRAFVKVQDGCRYRCTFCIVTVARGEESSRRIDDVVAEINALHRQGVQEFVLTGVHLGGWGSDLDLRLPDLLAAVLQQTAAPRIRLGSLEPWELTDEFFALLANPRLMPHLHLPLQSGADSVLKRMARRCKTADFAALVDRARASCPNINITTDIIVGFPGETEAEWADSMAFIDALGFGHIHIFSYSARSGTRAATLPDPVAAPVKKARAQQLQALALRHKHAALARQVGQEVAVLWEEGQPAGEDGRRVFRGFTPNYLRVETVAAAGVDLCRQVLDTRLLAVAAAGDRLQGALSAAH